MLVPKFFVVSELIRVATFAGLDAPVEVSPLHWVSRQYQCGTEVLARSVASPAAKLELTACCQIERVGGKTIAAFDGVDRFEAALRAIALRHRNGTVEGNDRGRPYRH